MIALLLLGGICTLSVNSVAHASAYDSFAYKKGDKLYTEKSITKGKKQLTKNTNKKQDATQYQVVKMTKNTIYLRPQQGYCSSVDPYFKKKTLKYKLSSKCKFYYNDASFPSLNKYKKVSKSAVKSYMKERQPYYGHIYDAYTKDGRSLNVKGKYYTGGYFGYVYIKSGKVVAVIMNGGD
jgi:ribosomal protein S8